MKNSNRTRNLPASSVVPKPSALQRARGSELLEMLSMAVTVTYLLTYLLTYSMEQSPS